MSKGGGIASLAAPVLGFALGGPLGAAMGLEGAAAPIVGGALLGGGTNLLTGGNVLQGALSGGLGGYGDWTDLGGLAGGMAPVTDAAAMPVMSALGAGIDPAIAMTAGMADLPGAAMSSFSSPMAETAAMSDWAGASSAMPGAAGGRNFFQSDVLKRLMSNFGKNPLSGAWNVYSGIQGMNNSDKLGKMAESMAGRADPFAQYRPEFAAQLAGLMRDPSKVTSMPGYQAGLEAVQRSMASQGYTGSGNMMAELAKYGGNFFGQEVNRLAGLSGANVNPATSASMYTDSMMNSMMGQMSSMGLIGGGLRQWGL